MQALNHRANAYNTSSAARRGRAGAWARRAPIVVAAQNKQQEAATAVQTPAPFPTSYVMAMRQAQEAVKAALADGAKLVEVEFPSTTLSSVSGDGEGQNEMNASMGYLRTFLGGFRSRAASTRVFFPDNVELAVARSGQTEDPSAGRKALDPQFADVTFQLGYLTEQNAAWAMFGFYKSAFDPVKLVKDTDDLLVVAYPSFNPREELSAVYELYQQKAKARGMPIVIFNGELDRVRGGYYPSVFFPEIAVRQRAVPADDHRLLHPQLQRHAASHAVPLLPRPLAAAGAQPPGRGGRPDGVEQRAHAHTQGGGAGDPAQRLEVMISEFRGYGINVWKSFVRVITCKVVYGAVWSRARTRWFDGLLK
eukprot:XP_001698718.1 predicted protein [Chlamydomonas reinhardtii]